MKTNKSIDKVFIIIKQQGNCLKPIRVWCADCLLHDKCDQTLRLSKKYDRNVCTELYYIAIEYLLENGYNKSDIVDIII